MKTDILKALNVFKVYPYLIMDKNLLDDEYAKYHLRLLNGHLYISCYVKTYIPNDYIVVKEGFDNLHKEEFIRKGLLSKGNIYGNKKPQTYNISNPFFYNEGKAAAIVILNYETLILEQIYYFADETSTNVLIYNDSEDYITFSVNGMLYVKKINESNPNFYMILRSYCNCWGNYLMVYADGDYGGADSISIIDLETRREYNLANELSKRGVRCVDVLESKIDIHTQIVFIQVFCEEESFELPLDYIKRNCEFKIF